MTQNHCGSAHYRLNKGIYYHHRNTGIMILIHDHCINFSFVSSFWQTKTFDTLRIAFVIKDFFIVVLLRIFHYWMNILMKFQIIDKAL